MSLKSWIAPALGLGLVWGCEQARAESYDWGNVVFEGGGFVDGIVPSHTQPGLVYARTDVGGAYRWDSTGGQWIALMDWVSQPDLGLYGTESVALDPRDSKRLYILCGTSYFSNGLSMILRSDDYGATFDTVNVTAQILAHGNGMGRQSGEKLAVDPHNSAILFCGTRTKGLFHSADTGKTWSLVAGTVSLSGTDIVNQDGITYVLFDSSSGTTAGGGTKTIYLGVANDAASLYVSNDGGATFNPIAGAPAQMALRATLSGGYLYGTYSDGPGPFNQSGGSVWKMNTATGAWTNISPKDDSGFVYGTGHEGYGYSFGGISADPQNPLRLILSTESFYGGNDLWPDGKANAGDVIFLTEDGGATWKNLNPKSATTPNLDANGNNWIDGNAIHWAGSLEFDPFNTQVAWVGSGNGVFRTDDITPVVPVWKFQAHGLEETVPMDLVSVPGGPLVTALMDYDGSTYTNILQSAPQHTPTIGSDNVLGYAAQAGWFIRGGRVTDYSVNPSRTYDVLYRSQDQGETWAMTDTATLPGSGGDLALSADGKVMLLRPSNTHNGVNASPSTYYRSADSGNTWTAVTGLNTQTGRMVADPVNPADFYIIPDGYQGDVLGSTNGGVSFAKVGSLIDNTHGLTSASSGLLRAAPGAAGDLWVPLDAVQSWSPSGYSANGLAHSVDGGKTWSRDSSMDACLSIGLGKAAPGAAYYALYMWGKANGGPLGIYRSIDKGQTWMRVNDDQHQYGGPANGNFVLGDMNVYGRVYMSTAGRGIVYGEPVGTNAIAPRAAGHALPSLYRYGEMLFSQGANTIRLVDLRGRLIRTSEKLGGIARLDLSGLPRGLYVAHCGGAAMVVDGVK